MGDDDADEVLHKKPAVRRDTTLYQRSNAEQAQPDPDPRINSPPSSVLKIHVLGGNENGELGLGPFAVTEIEVPVLNKLLENEDIVQVAAGGMHCVALTRDSRILTWGVNDAGALGRDTPWPADSLEDCDANPAETTPAAVSFPSIYSGTVFTMVAASDNASFAITETGKVYAWGTFRSSDGVERFLPAIDVQRQPMRIPGLKSVKKILAGNNHAVILTSHGCVYTWGLSNPARPRGPAFSVPSKMGLRGVLDIGVGGDCAFAMCAGGLVYGWGRNDFHQTGILDYVHTSDAYIETPTLVESLAGLSLRAITGGNGHTFATTTLGVCFPWGRLDNFATGLDINQLSSAVIWDMKGNPRVLTEPTKISGLAYGIVSSGSDHGVYVGGNGNVYTWGLNISHQTGFESDFVKTPRHLNAGSIRSKNIVWAGAGGHFTILAEYR